MFGIAAVVSLDGSEVGIISLLIPASCDSFGSFCFYDENGPKSFKDIVHMILTNPSGLDYLGSTGYELSKLSHACNL